MTRQVKNTRSDRLDEARLAVGAILGFYRRIRKIPQGRLVAGGEKLHKSAVAMFEAGKRLPSIEAIGKLATALKLSSLQRRQLEMLADYPRHPSTPGHEWFLPDDVLSGIPIFLRDLKKEVVFQIEADIQEMWVVASRPLALEGEMYTMLSDRLAGGKTSFLYFLDAANGETPFRALWGKLAAEPRHRPKDLRARLKCILTPSLFCLHHFAICNPSDDFGKMFGRFIIYAGGSPVGYVAMDAQEVTRAYRLLEPIYQQCKLAPGRQIPADYGRFSLLEPSFGKSLRQRTPARRNSDTQ